MRAKLIVLVAAAGLVALVSPALAQKGELTPLGRAGTASATVSASEPLTALAVGLGLLGARLLRRRR